MRNLSAIDTVRLRLLALATGLIALAIFAFWPSMALALGGLALLDALAPVLSPALARYLLAPQVRLATVLGRLFLLIVFWGVLTPLSFLLRALHVDPLRRDVDRCGVSFW